MAEDSTLCLQLISSVLPTSCATYSPLYTLWREEDCQSFAWNDSAVQGFFLQRNAIGSGRNCRNRDLFGSLAWIHTHLYRVLKLSEINDEYFLFVQYCTLLISFLSLLKMFQWKREELFEFKELFLRCR